MTGAMEETLGLLQSLLSTLKCDRTMVMRLGWSVEYCDTEKEIFEFCISLDYGVFFGVCHVKSYQDTALVRLALVRRLARDTV